MKILFPLLAALLFSGFSPGAIAQTQDFAAAVSAGKVSVTFRGTGGSSGDSIEATVVTTSKTNGDLLLTIAPGTRLQSGNSSAQIMVIAGVRGLVVDANQFEARSQISVSATPRTYVFDAYCTDFEKDNPSTGTQFRLGQIDPVLACILAQSNSMPVKQAAVWIYTDKASFSHVNQKFDVTQSEWDAAAALVKKCSTAAEKPIPPKPPQP